MAPTVLALVALLVAAPPLFVEVTDRDACEHGARIPAALARITGLEVTVRPAPAGGLSLKVRKADAELSLELDDPRGPGIHDRRIANPIEACAATADGVALIVERYLRSLGILPPEPPPPPLPPPPPPPPPPSPPPPAIDARTATVSIPSAPGPPLRLALRALGLLSAPATGGSRWGGVAELSAQIGPLFVAASGAATLPVEQVVERQDRPLGTFRLWSLVARASLGLCFELAGWLCPALDVGAERTVGEAIGRLPTQAEVPLVRPVFGASARYDFEIVGPIGISASVAGVVRPAAATFTVDGADQAYQEVVFTLLFAAGVSVEIL